MPEYESAHLGYCLELSSSSVYFRFLIIASHLGTMRNCVFKALELVQLAGYSFSVEMINVFF